MRAAEEFAHTDTDFIAGHCRRQQIAPGTAERLRHRQHCGEYDGSRMKYRAVVDIVLFGKVRRCGVDHRGKQRCRLAARDQDFGTAGGWSHLLGKPFNRFHRTCTFAGQSGAEPVEEKVFCAPYHRFRNVVKLKSGRKGGQCLTWVLAHFVSSLFHFKSTVHFVGFAYRTCVLSALHLRVHVRFGNGVRLRAACAAR